MQFKTPYITSERFFAPVGSFTRQLYKATLGKNGEIVLKEDGLEFTFEKMQSFKDSCDINVIISRFEAGDSSVLEQSSGVYGDFVEVPTSYMDILNAIVDARTQYELSKPDMSFDEYIKNLILPKGVEKNEVKENVENAEPE